VGRVGHETRLERGDPFAFLGKLGGGRQTLEAQRLPHVARDNQAAGLAALRIVNR